MKMRSLYIFTALSVSLLLTHTAQADTLRVDCVPPTTREDGSALLAAEIASYELITTHSAGEVHTYTLSGCGVNIVVAKIGSYTAVMHTLDTVGRRSKPSNTATFVVKGSGPSAPTNLRITYPVDPTGAGR